MLLIGYGYWGKILHRVFKNEVIAICDHKFLGADYFRVDQAVKKHKGPKIAIIATPASTHFDIAKNLIEHGYDIWLEKPATDSIEKIDRLIELSLKNDTVVFVNHVYCYDENIQKIKQMKLSDPIYYRSIRLAPGIIRNDVSLALDLAIHDLSIIEFLYPDLKVCSKKITNLNQDHILLDLEFDNNLNVNIECSWSFPTKKRLIVSKYLDNTFIHDSAEKNILRLYDSKLQEIDAFEAKTETIQNAKQHFLECIANRKIPKTNLYNAKKIMEWIHDT